MTIPPIEERQVRPCLTCVFCKNKSTECVLDIKSARPNCDKHFTHNEIYEVIEKYNSGELPDWVKEIIKTRLQKLNTAPRKDRLPKAQLYVADILLNWVLTLRRTE